MEQVAEPPQHEGYAEMVRERERTLMLEQATRATQWARPAAPTANSTWLETDTGVRKRSLYSVALHQRG